MCIILPRLDASEDDGSLERLVNDRHRKPNANAKVIEVDGQVRIAIFAVGDIAAGEEIRYNYRKNLEFPWRKKSSYFKYEKENDLRLGKRHFHSPKPETLTL